MNLAAGITVEAMAGFPPVVPKGPWDPGWPCDATVAAVPVAHPAAARHETPARAASRPRAGCRAGMERTPICGVAADPAGQRPVETRRPRRGSPYVT